MRPTRGAADTGPAGRGWAFLDHPGPIAFAHRGGAGDLPENTMSAFQRAVDLGYRYLETDVHVTADGVVVAFHDDVLDRVTDRTGRIADLPWAEVRSAVVGDDERVPSLEDVLGTWPEVRVNIDPKHDASVRPLVEVLRRARAFDRVCVAAFSDRRLALVRRLTGNQVCTALGPRDIGRLRVAAWGAALTGPIAGACVQIPVRHGRVVLADRRFVTAAHRRGLPVHVWTVDDPATMGSLLDLGVDGIMTDRPAVLRDVLEARGQWVVS
ncbi:MAG: glycerophosphodiester phosphodiesterase [Acidimicrobiia bacterium]